MRAGWTKFGSESTPCRVHLLMRALVVFVISFSLVFLATWLILLTNPFTLDQISIRSRFGLFNHRIIVGNHSRVEHNRPPDHHFHHVRRTPGRDHDHDRFAGT